MAGLRQDVEHEIRGLEEIDHLNDEKIKEIKGLRDNLFSGTSVLESRKSVQQQAITVQQRRNIKLLTLVTIFFLPLTFVTPVFGMTNMKPTPVSEPLVLYWWSFASQRTSLLDRSTLRAVFISGPNRHNGCIIVLCIHLLLPFVPLGTSRNGRPGISVGPMSKMVRALSSFPHQFSLLRLRQARSQSASDGMAASRC